MYINNTKINDDDSEPLEENMENNSSSTKTKRYSYNAVHVFYCDQHVNIILIRLNYIQ